jgi:hypothetical protein
MFHWLCDSERGPLFLSTVTASDQRGGKISGRPVGWSGVGSSSGQLRPLSFPNPYVSLHIFSPVVWNAERR